MEIGSAACARGYRLEVFETLASTSDEAMARARTGETGQLWVLARRQTAGRGRMARPWSSPLGNLYASLLLIDPAPQALAPQLGFVAGVALADALDALMPQARRVRLKWPNDLLVDGAKLAGVLLEATTQPGGRFACVIGFGVNCASHPQTTPYPATSLAAFCQANVEATFAALSDLFAIWLETWDRGRNFAVIREAWLERALPTGAPLQVRDGVMTIEGAFETLDAQGRLVLMTAQGARVFSAGDVFPVLPAAGDGAQAMSGANANGG